MPMKVVITGMGVVSPVGNNCEQFWTSLVNGKSGIDRVSLFDVSDYTTKIAGEVKGVDYSQFLEEKEVRRTDRYILHALAAAHEAIEDAELKTELINPHRFGVIVGSGIGGILTLEQEFEKLLSKGPKRVSPFLIPMMIPDMAAGMISIKYGLKGINYAVVSACASASHCLGDVFSAIRNGQLDGAVVGGAEATVCRVAMSGFNSLKALSTRNEQPQKASSPFDIKRDGFVMGEGAGIFVVESLEHAQNRNAKIYAELAGYGATGDAFHITAPETEGMGAQQAMQFACESAGIQCSEIGYINAHGTSTPFNDKIESRAIMKVFGEDAYKVNISSTKSMTGHLLGASGAIEGIASVLALCNNRIPPTINYEDPDPECPLNYTPNTAVSRNLKYVMSNSFGFGGHNASLIFKKYEPTV